MELRHIRIENYKGLRAIDLPLSRFGCVIGENNAGKSSLLQALSLVLTGTTLTREHLYDDSKPIRIAIRIDEISQSDLDTLEESHREKVAAIITDSALTLVRNYGLDGKGVLQYEALVPTEPKYGADFCNNLLKGKRAK